MSAITHVLGRLTAAPEVKYVPSGDAVCQVRLAVDDGTKDREHASFIPVEVWGRQAENLAKYMGKGSRVYVTGKLWLDQWEKDGERKSRLIVKAFRVLFCDPLTGSKAVQAQNEQDQTPPAQPEDASQYVASENMPF